MALPQGFILEQTQEDVPTKSLPAGFQLEESSTLQKTDQGGTPSMFSKIGRGVASALDATLGSLLPTAVQMGAYPLARLGRAAYTAHICIDPLRSAR